MLIRDRRALCCPTIRTSLKASILLACYRHFIISTNGGCVSVNIYPSLLILSMREKIEMGGLSVAAHCPAPIDISLPFAIFSIEKRWFCALMQRWRRGAVGRVSDLRSRGRGFKSRPGTRRKNTGQVSHTYVPLFTKQYSWYRPKGGDALRLGSKGRYGLCAGAAGKTV